MHDPALGIVSNHVLQALQLGGPQTVEQLGNRCGLPTPHVRAAVTELCYVNRLVTSDGRNIVAGPPPGNWPKAPSW